MRIIFWNTNKKATTDDIVDLSYEQDIDIIILAECTIPIDTISNNLRSFTGKKFYSYKNKDKNEKLKIITRIDTKYLKSYDKKYEGTYWSINRFEVKGIKPLNLVSVHFPSKSHWNDISQSMESVNFMINLRNFEAEFDKNTILIGDFNMNPFESGMVSSIGIHGMKDEKITKKNSRIVLGREYDYFYNPMWNFLGDKNSVPGTYYYAKSIHYNEPWNTFDQVLIRPQLLDNFVYSDLKILTRIKNKELYNHKTNKLFISDHLPILININL